MQAGLHTLFMGGEYINYYYSQYSPGNLAGSYAFNCEYTGVNGQANIVNAIADLELGLNDHDQHQQYLVP